MGAWKVASVGVTTPSAKNGRDGSHVAGSQGAQSVRSPSSLAVVMARFPEAEKRLLIEIICRKCYARNAPSATWCRRCGSKELRLKAKEARKE